MVILRDAGKDQGGFRAAEGPSQQLTVLREAAGVGVRILQDAGRDQGGWFFCVSRWQGFVKGGSLATLSLACGCEV